MYSKQQGVAMVKYQKKSIDHGYRTFTQSKNLCMVDLIWRFEIDWALDYETKGLGSNPREVSSCFANLLGATGRRTWALLFLQRWNEKEKKKIDFSKFKNETSFI